MSESLIIKGTTKEERYQSLHTQLISLIKSENDALANLCNIIAALKYEMNYLWVGVYFVKQNKYNLEELVLGPFQGPIACTRIAYGKGVCGTAWKNKETVLVDDVANFPGHIACSGLSKSEIVIPIFDTNNIVKMVLDIDSEKISNFDETDKYYLVQISKLIQPII